jgi:hypothetical protein
MMYATPSSAAEKLIKENFKSFPSASASSKSFSVSIRRLLTINWWGVDEWSRQAMKRKSA